MVKYIPKITAEERNQNLVEAGKSTRFGQPGGNKPGLTSERARLMIESQERAARIQAKLLEAIETEMDQVLEIYKDHGPDVLHDLVAKINKPNTVALIKMIQDRELGTPRQSLDLSNSDGSFTPPIINIGFIPPNDES